jgi:hypothetical protein
MQRGRRANHSLPYAPPRQATTKTQPDGKTIFEEARKPFF